jgi:relaxase-like protein
VIVKGSPRKDGHALALYFMNSEDGARRLFGTDPMGDTITAMTEWDEIGSLTRGEKPLYHMQLCPDARYPVTDGQWKRMTEIVLEEIGAKGHDYELYFHPGVKGDGEPDKPHAHLGVCRTNRDTLKMLDLSYNYVAHERASKRIALEFGWELVPGKHAKRDREKQEDFPRQKLTKDEDQYQERTGLSKEDRIKELTALRATADNGPAFKAALEDAGYILAQGDRGYLVVDQKGGQSVLSRNVGLKKKEIEAFMAGVPLDQLPTVEEAKAVQAERRKTVLKSDTFGKPEKQGVEASKFLQAKEPAKAPERAPEPPAPQILPEKQETVMPAPPEGWTQKELTPQFPALQPPPAPPAPPEPPSLDPEVTKLRDAILKRQTQEYRAAADRNAEEYRVLQAQLKNSMPTRMEDFTLQQAAALQAFRQAQKPSRKGLKGLLDKFRDHIDPEAAAEREENRKQDLQRFRSSQRDQKKDFIKNLRVDNRAALDALRARHLDEQKQREKSYDGELERRLGDRQRAIDIAREQSEWAKEFEKELEFRDGEEPPPPKLGK